MNGGYKYLTLEDAQKANRERSRTYYYSNKEKMAEYRKKYYAENRERLILQKRLKRQLQREQARNNIQEQSPDVPNIDCGQVDKLFNSGTIVRVI